MKNFLFPRMNNWHMVETTVIGSGDLIIISGNIVKNCLKKNLLR